MEIDGDDHSFSVILNGLKDGSKKRDPRSLRLAAVTAALVEVAGSDPHAKAVYAKAVTALEGTLQESGSISETLATQVALLELLQLTIPHVQPAAILTATLPLTSRVLRAIVASSQAIGAKGPMETKDELGGVNAVLRGACRATLQVLKHLEAKADHNAVKQLFNETLVTLFQDKRPKVRKAAYNGTLELLMVEEPMQCHPSIRRAATSYSHALLAAAKREKHNESLGDVLHLLGFLEQGVLFLDYSKLGDDLMQLLAKLIQVDESSVASDFVTMSKVKDETPKMLTVAALLSVVTSVLEDASAERAEKLHAFAPRVLASLLQASPELVFRNGIAEFEMLQKARTLYGLAVVASCHRVLVSDPEMACRLLPLSVQAIVKLSKPSDEDMEDPSVAETLMVELTQLFRMRLPSFMDTNAANVDACLDSALKAMGKVLVDLDYRPTFSASLQAVVVLVQFACPKLNVQNYVKSLLELRNQIKPSGSSSQRAVEEAFSSLVQAVGMETCWKWLDLQSTASDGTGISVDQAWILPVLKSSMQIAQSQTSRLAFFQQEILAIARVCDRLAATANAEKKNFHHARVVDLWSLLPCFCLRPSDVESSLPALTTTLCRAIEDNRYPQLVAIICGGLRNLCKSVRDQSESDSNKDIDAVREASAKLLPVLFKLATTTTSESSGASGGDSEMMDEGSKPPTKKDTTGFAHLQSVVEATTALAGFAPEKFLLNLFKKLMHRLLEEAQSDAGDRERISSFLSLSQGLVKAQVLDESNISFLYRALKPLIRNDETDPRVQKRAYKVLAEICERNHAFVTEIDRLKELTSLLTDTMMSSQVSARCMRLKCIGIVVDGLGDDSPEQMTEICNVAAEIILCLKDTNAKTREAAFHLIVSLTSRDTMGFLKLVVAALGAETSHMRSAAVVALSRIVFEFAWENEELQGQLPSLLRMVIVLMDENSREVVKSVIGFVRISVAAIPAPQLEPLLPELVGGLMQFHKVKSRFRPKIKIILKKLVKLFSYDELMPYVPESEARLLTHMRKLDERKQRKKVADKSRPEIDSFDHMLDSDEEDSDDGRTLMTGATSFSRMAGNRDETDKPIPGEESASRFSKTQGSRATSKSMRDSNSAIQLSNEADGDVVDMLGSNVARRVKFAEDQMDDSDSDDGMMEFDDDGRLIVPDDLKIKDHVPEEDVVEVPSTKRPRLDKPAEDRSRTSRKSDSKKDRPLGAAYKSKKAGGDVKKKGQKYEPYAFVPLDGRSYSKKNRRSAVEQMSSVVRKGTKRNKR
jgi:ribosomal RNA-processing protein 12